MFKKIAVILAAVIIVSIAFAAAWKHFGGKTQEAAEAKPVATCEDLSLADASLKEEAEKLASCEVNTDCVSVPVSACPCELGGESGAINKKHLEEFLKLVPSVDRQLCGGENRCVPAGEPLCQSNRCFIGKVTMLNYFLKNKDTQGYLQALSQTEWDPQTDGPALVNNVLVSALTEEQKLELVTILLQKEIPLDISHYSSILSAGGFKLAQYLTNHSKMPKTVNLFYFKKHYLKQPAPDASEEVLEAEEQKRLFPLENGFALDCGEDGELEIPSMLESSADKRQTALFLMALGVLPKENLDLKSLQQETKACADKKKPCRSIQKAIGIVSPQLTKNTVEKQVEDIILLPSLQKYRQCARHEDCEIINFGPCNSEQNVVTAINGRSRTALLKDNTLLKKMRNVYKNKNLSDWCPQESSTFKDSFKTGCEQGFCVAHPSKRMNVIII